MRTRRIIAVLLVVSASLALGAFVMAQGTPPPAIETPTPIETEVVIPGSEVVIGTEGFFRGRVRDLADYIDNLYLWLISIVGAFAAVVLMMGGFQYLTAGGSQDRLNAAKKRILNALVGLVLALTSYTLLATVNPGLVTFQVPEVQEARTEIVLLPWCDEQPGATPVRIGFTSCGDIGSFTLGTGQGFCVYRSACEPQAFTRVNGISHGRHSAVSTCFQHGLSAEELEEHAELGKKAATCISCAGLNEESAARMDYAMGPNVCEAWQLTANRGPFPYKALKEAHAAGQFGGIRTRAHYCRASINQKFCVQSDMNCESITGEVGFLFSDANARCGEYDEGADAFFVGTDGTPRKGDLEDYGAHLLNVCMEDPCGAGRGSECKPDSPVFSTFVFLGGGAFGTVDCRAD